MALDANTALKYYNHQSKTQPLDIKMEHFRLAVR